MGISAYLPKTFDDESCKYVQLALRCAPGIGFLAIYHCERDLAIAKKVDTEEKSVWFFARAKEYSKSQKIAGGIAILTGLVLLLISHYAMLPSSRGLLIGGGVSIGVGALHLMFSSFMNYDKGKGNSDGSYGRASNASFS